MRYISKRPDVTTQGERTCVDDLEAIEHCADDDISWSALLPGALASMHSRVWAVYIPGSAVDNVRGRRGWLTMRASEVCYADTVVKGCALPEASRDAWDEGSCSLTPSVERRR